MRQTIPHLCCTLAVLAGAALLVPTTALATGTPAGTPIVNQATATYDIGDNSFSQPSNEVITYVAEILDVIVTWQDASEVLVSEGDTSQVLTFLVTNIGNGTDDYLLNPNSSVGGDDFNPIFDALFLDTNGNGSYDPGIDLQYIPGFNDPVLAADSSVTVFAINDIPAPLPDGAEGDHELTATSNTGTGTPGTVYPNAGDTGVNAVVGTTGATDDDIGTYKVSSVTVRLLKSATVEDPFGGSEPVPGAKITYSIEVAIAGSGIAENLVITDPIPVFTTYDPGTLYLGPTLLSDIADVDPGDVDDTSPGVVTVFLGNVASGAPMQTIRFTVIID